MSARNRERFDTIRTEGGLLPAELLARIATKREGFPGLTSEDYHLGGEPIEEAIARSWNRLVGVWSSYRTALESLPVDDPATTVTRNRWLLILFETLGYGRLQTETARDIDGETYAISHQHGHVPIHLVGANVELDRRTSGLAGAARMSPHGLVQEYLNRTDESLWGIVSNGNTLRLLRDNKSLTRQAYVEFDLQSMMTGEVYADFALFWRLVHESRLDRDTAPGETLLEQWRRHAQEQGTRALDGLRDGVAFAISELGAGFLIHPANQHLRDALRSGTLDRQDYYRQLLRLVYRLIFLFVAEDRADENGDSLLLDPKADDTAKHRYRSFYSTRRLRTIAERIRGTAHADLFRGLRVVMEKLGDDNGCAELALPALGGFLWERNSVKDIGDCDIANEYLLEAVRKLTLIHADDVRQSVDYENLGSEELGSVYESLLELHPEMNVDAGTFALKTAAGHERKSTGSYYTPESLVQQLLKTALEPVLDQAVRRKTREEADAAILKLKVCDPAAGSGHFLIAAAHRIAHRLAAIRADGEPSPAEVRHALREVIGHCIYGVDLNPMAVELCKVSLWMEALEPGKPLRFLDHRIKVGNSLIGATRSLMNDGIPDDAFSPIEGDTRTFCSSLKRDNKKERGGKLQSLFGTGAIKLGDLPNWFSELDTIDEENVADVRTKADLYADLVQSTDYRFHTLLADTWCAAFVIPKIDDSHPWITEGVYRRIQETPHSASPALRTEIERLARQYRFFHWHIAFPDVFDANGQGGFDLVLGNPPWERIKLQEKEWFAERVPEIAAAPNAAARTRLIQQLKDNPESRWMYDNFLADRRQAEGESHFVRNSGRYPLCGRGDVNTYSIFAELNRSLINGAGRVGCILPSGIATDDTTKFFFQDLIERQSLVSLYDFENRKAIFPAIDSRMKFCLMTLTGPARPAAEAEFAFFLLDVVHLGDTERRFTLSAEDIALINPNTRTAPIFRSQRDAEITKAVYRRVPVLIRDATDDAPEENPWSVSFKTLFHMSNDSGLFRTREELESDGWTLVGNRFARTVGGVSETMLPLYEAKMIHQFDHRWATYRGTDTQDVTDAEKSDPSRLVLPRYWVHEREVRAKLANRRAESEWSHDWLMGWRDITNTTNERTVIANVIPRVGVGNKIPLVFPRIDRVDLYSHLIGDQASFAHDFVSRNKIGGTSLNYFIYKQLPVLPPSSYDVPAPWSPEETIGAWLLPRVVELTYTAWDLAGFGADMGYPGPPFRWDVARRFQLRCELDAAYFHLYGIARDDADYIMDTFPIVRRHDEAEHGEYRTKRVILERYDAIAAAASSGGTYATVLDPPAGDASVRHGEDTRVVWA